MNQRRRLNGNSKAFYPVKGSTGKIRRVRKRDVQSQSSGVIARPLPAKFKVRMTYQNSETFGSSTKVVRALSEFLARPPMYYNYLYGIYKYARVLAVELEVSLSNNTNDACRFAIGRAPFSDVSGITYSQFSEMPDVYSALLPAKGGMDSKRFYKFYIARDANGGVLTDHTYWVNSAQAISTTPLHNDDYVILLMSDGTTANAGFNAVIKVHYHIEWFTLQYAV